ncbi:MAG: type II toxin-antitoxin system VapC family toxin [Candidatus Dadabacteria bacterium]|nr:MAG: type II toxin-antitoxin system VapC family toxin [Candidatus Dadabacteria bacterium]
MTRRFGIDTSILVRLLTGDPEDEFRACVEALTQKIEGEGAEVFASNMVIAEAYIAVQHHYGVTKAEARQGLLSVLQSGLVAPLNGRGVLDALKETGGCGLVDRLITDDYRAADLLTLTLDRRMARLPGARRL